MLATDYIKGLRARQVLASAWRDMFHDVDVLVTPTVPFAAPLAGQHTVTWSDGTVEAVHDATIRLTSAANIVGLPALSVPVGHDADGMPLGMQIHGRPFDEAAVLRVGRGYELATGTPTSVAPV